MKTLKEWEDSNLPLKEFIGKSTPVLIDEAFYLRIGGKPLKKESTHCTSLLYYDGNNIAVEVSRRGFAILNIK